MVCHRCLRSNPCPENSKLVSLQSYISCPDGQPRASSLSGFCIDIDVSARRAKFERTWRSLLDHSSFGHQGSVKASILQQDKVYSMGESVDLTIDAVDVHSSTLKLELTPLSAIETQEIDPGNSSTFHFNILGDYTLTLKELDRSVAFEETLASNFSFRCRSDYKQVGNSCQPTVLGRTFWQRHEKVCNPLEYYNHL